MTANTQNLPAPPRAEQRPYSYERHGIRLHRKKGALSKVFAEFFKIDDDTVKADLREVSKRLGPTWYQSDDQK